MDVRRARRRIRAGGADLTLVAGIDCSTLAIDLVTIDVDTQQAVHIRRRLDTAPGASLARTRRVRDAMPPRQAWIDAGVVLVAIEEPYSRSTMGGQVPLHRVIGAILAVLPTTIAVELVRSDDWRRTSGLPTRGKREVLKAAAVEYARANWSPEPPVRLDDNTADAYCIARHALSLI